MNADGKTRQFLPQIVDRLVSAYQPERIILFGSYARGDYDEQSDVDLLIVKPTTDRPLDRRVQVRRHLSDIVRPFGLDLLVVTPDELSRRLEMGSSFYRDILSEGEVLYEREQYSNLPRMV